MYRTVVDAALIEAAQRIAPLVRARRDEGEQQTNGSEAVPALRFLPERCGQTLCDNRGPR
jgi:hypothetical protein